MNNKKEIEELRQKQNFLVLISLVLVLISLYYSNLETKPLIITGALTLTGMVVIFLMIPVLVKITKLQKNKE
jgi:membrane protein YdbS with pleckstrin-like domain